MRIVYFTFISILIHIAVFAIPINLTIIGGNSDIANEFTNGKIGRLTVTLTPAPKVVTQADLNRPILDFMEQENFDLLLEEDCEVPF